MHGTKKTIGELVILAALLLTGFFLFQKAQVLQVVPDTQTISSSVSRAMLRANPNAKTVSVLFIGNSYTSVNDLPKTVSDVAASLGDIVNSDMSAPGGYTLQQHMADQTTLAKIKAQPWNVVVLQEQSLLPVSPDAQTAVTVEPYAKQLVQTIRSADPAAKIIFYETWGRKDGDSDFCESSPAFCTYASMQAQLDKSYGKIASENAAELAPVGEAWSTARQTHPGIELYQSDGSHPSAEGTYLAACVFYEALFKRSVLGAGALSIDPAQAKILQQIAHDTVAGK